MRQEPLPTRPRTEAKASRSLQPGTPSEDRNFLQALVSGGGRESAPGVAALGDSLQVDFSGRSPERGRLRPTPLARSEGIS